MLAPHKIKETEDIDKLKNEIKLVEDKNISEHINKKVSKAVQVIVNAKLKELQYHQSDLLQKLERIEEENSNLRKREKILESRLVQLEGRKKRKIDTGQVTIKQPSEVKFGTDEEELQPKENNNEVGVTVTNNNTSTSNQNSNDDFCPPLFRSEQEISNGLPMMRVKPTKKQDEENLTSEKQAAVLVNDAQELEKITTENVQTAPVHKGVLLKQNVLNVENPYLKPRSHISSGSYLVRNMTPHDAAIRQPVRHVVFEPSGNRMMFPMRSPNNIRPNVMPMSQQDAIRFQQMRQQKQYFRHLSPRHLQELEHRHRIEMQQQQFMYQQQVRYQTSLKNKENEQQLAPNIQQNTNESLNKQQFDQLQQQKPQARFQQDKNSNNANNKQQEQAHPLSINVHEPFPQPLMMSNHLPQEQLRPALYPPISPCQLYQFRPQVLPMEQYHQINMQTIPSTAQPNPIKDNQPKQLPAPPPEKKADPPGLLRPPPPYEECVSIPLPKLTASITSDTSNIILKWDCSNESKKYQQNVHVYFLMAYHTMDLRMQAPRDLNQWKKIGEIQSLPLPIACTLTRSFDGNNYFFAVIPLDKSGRLGELSNCCKLRVAL